MKRLLLLKKVVFATIVIILLGVAVFLIVFLPQKSVDLTQEDLTFKEISNYFTDIAQKKGAEYAFNVLRTASLPANTDIHLLGHVVGDELYKQRGLPGMEVCTQEFRNACSHSVVIGAFLDDGEEVLNNINEACKGAPGGSGAYTMCFHGFGHGVLAYLDYEFDLVAPLCEKVGTENYRDREYIECVGGALMELTGGVHDVATRIEKSKKYFKEEDPLYPCSASFVPEEVKPICYTYLTPYLFEVAGGDLGSLTPHDYEKAFKYCDAIPEHEKENRVACFGGFGKEFVVLAQDRDVRIVDKIDELKLQDIANWCSFSEEYGGVLHCLDSALQSLYWGGENDRGAAIQFCSILQKDYQKQFCVDRLINSISYFIDDQLYRREFCAELPLPYQEQCRLQLITK